MGSPMWAARIFLLLRGLSGGGCRASQAIDGIFYGGRVMGRLGGDACLQRSVHMGCEVSTKEKLGELPEVSRSVSRFGIVRMLRRLLLPKGPGKHHYGQARMGSLKSTGQEYRQS